MNKKTKIETCLSSEIKPLPSTPQAISKGFDRYLTYHLGRYQGCDPFYFYEALSFSLRDRVVVDWRKTWEEYRKPEYAALTIYHWNF